MQQSHSNVVVLVIAVGSSVGGGLANFLAYSLLFLQFISFFLHLHLHFIYISLINR